MSTSIFGIQRVLSRTLNPLFQRNALAVDSLIAPPNSRGWRPNPHRKPKKKKEKDPTAPGEKTLQVKNPNVHHSDLDYRANQISKWLQKNDRVQVQFSAKKAKTDEIMKENQKKIDEAITYLNDKVSSLLEDPDSLVSKKDSRATSSIVRYSLKD